MEVKEICTVKTYVVKGEKGDAGAGFPTGGSTGQVLAKASNANYDTVWSDGYVKLSPTTPQTGDIDITGAVKATGTNQFTGTTNHTGRLNADGVFNSISGAGFDSNYTAKTLDVRAVVDPSADWYGLRFNGVDKSVKIGSFPFTSNTVSVTNGAVNIQRTPTADPSATQILTRDAITGELKHISITALKTLLNSI